MKWRIARTLIILAVVFQFQLIGFLNPTVERALASSTADVTVYFTPIGGGAPPPLSFTLTYIDDYKVKMDWTLGGTANNTMVRVKDNGYPRGPADGYLVYYGSAFSANDTAVDYYNFLGKKYYAAWTDNKTSDDDPNWGWSFSPVLAELEGPAVSDLVVQVANFNILLEGMKAQYLALFLMLALFVIALWRKEVFLYVVSALVTTFISLSWSKVYTSLSICLLGLACFQLYEAIMLAFFEKRNKVKKRKETEKE